MPRRLFRRLSPPRHRVLGQRWLQPLHGWLDHPDLWAIRRRAVSPAVALGLFWLWMPIPGHSIGAGLSAILLRVNLPVAMLMTFIVNPLTIVPIYYTGYLLGAAVLGTPEIVADVTGPEWLVSRFSVIWQPLLAGCILMGVGSAAIGYLLVDIAWRTRIGQYLQRRRRRATDDQRS